ncbi:DUF6745 domain-containing protein [Herbidospora daliensis]|uniref:DUF6745 domain-containing protein n=1 Tax=Herbidospora daliensis TaxID=295585 RepID=UPI000AC0561B|nr:hypothetical protein [Herbidospora daliensis]
MSIETTMTWADVAFTTGPGDRAEAEAGVREAYAAAGLAAPSVILWAGSPVVAAAAAAIHHGGEAAVDALNKAGLGSLILSAAPLLAQPLGHSVREEVRTQPWEWARADMLRETGGAGWARVWESTGALLWPRVNTVVQEIRRGLSVLGGEEAGDLLRQAALDAVLGQHDAAWLSAFADAPGLAGLTRVSRHAGWWFPYAEVAIVCERPAELHLDEAGRLHRSDGPALVFPDGFALEAWHGMPVPEGFVASMANLTPERIRNEENAELRRVMLEHFGFDRYLSESGATPLHRDETGILWRIALPNDEDVVTVEVVNSTAEPDGTFRTYFLRVPPWVQRARQGVAWTFGVNEENYFPEKET